jgi:glycosyltransferase involved in cell wall biosynthesis
MDVFVHPSVDDAMPVSIAEALMCGIPCVVCRVGGCADLVRDGVEGFVIEPRRTDQILAALEKFAEMPAEEFAAYRQHARARYEEVCLPGSVGHIVAEHYRAVIREAM